ncbi:transcription termination factor NusA [Candidatus Roizmanbacteria bacterium RIFCSPHIGHO2_02_FULL_40_13b]|nr:MAG: transcription termination factor NusA [Candidatus Roizmanbacteria bacterium RIFCSPHIGHO2_02_FULL_40_13b]OGK49137.1 MAG: transcription termination factor NusA [Candidatus Roizmanbacteria bacterium RIFCSPLOWO2_01_FULL_40_32]OGK57350.1 MAG: transcription termination factor NusA [Candidatus Roizmanbacteria bacterium RIFCSPLOWO2_02_FULL_39_8]
MTVAKSEFYLALQQVATERGISPEEVIISIKLAVLAAYRKDYHPDIPEDQQMEDLYEVHLDENTGETKILKDGEDITPAGFGRIAAQTARQVIMQKIREAEKKTIVGHYQTQIGTVVKGRIIRFEGKTIIADIGRAEGVMPPEEQMRNEPYDLNTSLTFYIKEIREDDFRGSRIIISRAHPKLVEELFKKEVPEIANGTVQIKNVAREPGERSKIAVFSTQSGVDPVGACVGQRGMRVKSVTDELGGEEKVDIIQYNDDIAFFVREALSPAQTISVEIDKERKIATVTVDATQAPLAIGRNGVNVNLAGRLTELEINVVQAKSEEIPEEKEPEEKVDTKVEPEVEDGK